MIKFRDKEIKYLRYSYFKIQIFRDILDPDPKLCLEEKNGVKNIYKKKMTKKTKVNYC